jgi:hypothetical protein
MGLVVSVGLVAWKVLRGKELRERSKESSEGLFSENMTSDPGWLCSM